MKVVVDALCIGQPKPFNGVELSAIDKQPVAGPVAIRSFGIEGDMVADTKHHGGPDMAVHHYPRDHYAAWGEWLGGHDLLARPAAFGENVHAAGITEADVHIGDHFRLGTVLLEVSQPRQPCWKIEHRFGAKGMVKRIIKQHNCGWYYRVIEEGMASAGDRLEQVETGHDEWSVARLFAKLYDPAHKASREELEEIAGLERLCELWRSKVRTTLDT
ncbi:MOSC domain-containing protein [Erythrobacter mangrovi]|uniref:MOSC domain-containing protein n=1 Tax=Erythrobacter mangrovi TaxID=2739433 RepID=A0A7D4C574_9SPHN|nr:MOSC domain-containing protein [Erythrobacter mangrovi]QKG71865.1 MOSC domain-containing protein [Erythrobacter mangrovi]